VLWLLHLQCFCPSTTCCAFAAAYAHAVVCCCTCSVFPAAHAVLLHCGLGDLHMRLNNI